jgi:hypothetical protein
MLVTNAQAGDLEVSARIPRFGRLLTAQPIDLKVKGVSVTNLDHSMELPPGRMHTVGFELERFSRSQLPNITTDPIKETRLLVHDTSAVAVWDKFKKEPAYEQVAMTGYCW